jgi:hypothetical protein
MQPLIALKYAKAYQECHDSSACTERQWQAEHGQQQGSEDPQEYTVDEGDHARRREEDLPPEWTCPRMEWLPPHIMSCKNEVGLHLRSLLQIELANARDASRINEIFDT